MRASELKNTLESRICYTNPVTGSRLPALEVSDGRQEVVLVPLRPWKLVTSAYTTRKAQDIRFSGDETQDGGAHEGV